MRKSIPPQRRRRAGAPSLPGGQALGGRPALRTPALAAPDAPGVRGQRRV